MPPEPSKVICLDVDDALEIFGALIGGSARQASDQLRDRAALAGALARGINYAQYEKAELALQAATPRPRHRGDQPFIDGNKRAALARLRSFELLYRLGGDELLLILPAPNHKTPPASLTMPEGRSSTATCGQKHHRLGRSQHRLRHAGRARADV